jgi:hypothetical protein
MPAAEAKEDTETAQELGATPMMMSGPKRIPELELRRIGIERDFDENQARDAFEEFRPRMTAVRFGLTALEAFHGLNQALPLLAERRVRIQLTTVPLRERRRRRDTDSEGDVIRKFVATDFHTFCQPPGAGDGAHR